MSRIRSSLGWPEFFAVILTADRESTFSLNGSTVLHQSLISFRCHCVIRPVAGNLYGKTPVYMNGGERLLRRPYWPETRTRTPLIKSQSQRGPKPNIDKKAQSFWTVACFFFRQWKVYVLPRFRHKTSTGGSPLGSASQKLTVALAEKHRLPAIYARRPVVEDLADTQ